ncbi:ROK family protein [Mariniluteicoccus endophyticus]
MHSRVIGRSRVIGIDLGGTKCSGATVAAGGELGEVHTRPTRAAAGPAAVLDAVADVVEACAAADPAARWDVGIGSAGVIDPARGVVVDATATMPGWTGTRIADGVYERLRTRGYDLGEVLVINDVDAHAAGEAWAGVAQGLPTALMVAVGTGVGGAYVVDGRPLSGRRGHCGEIGRIHVAGGLVDDLFSGPGIHRAYQSHPGRSDRDCPDTRAVFALTEVGDPVAREVVAYAARGLAGEVARLVVALDPHMLVLGGGVGLSRGLWREVFDAQVGAVAGDMPIAAAALGQGAGILGSARGLLA